MSEFTTTVTDYVEQRERHMPATPPTTLGGIVVRPPIQPGELFKNAILGRDSYGVELNHVITTDEATVFLASSIRGGVEARQADIHTIADRIGQLANAPDTVAQMISSGPFPLQER